VSATTQGYSSAWGYSSFSGAIGSTGAQGTLSASVCFTDRRSGRPLMSCSTEILGDTDWEEPSRQRQIARLEVQPA
jgi:hypothetical protein